MIIPPPIDDVTAPIMLMIPPLRPLNIEQWQHKSERETVRPPCRKDSSWYDGEDSGRAVRPGQKRVDPSAEDSGRSTSSRTPSRDIAGSPGRDATRVAPSPRTRACTGAAGTSPSDAPTGVYRLRAITTRIPVVVMDELARDLDAQAREGV